MNITPAFTPGRAGLTRRQFIGNVVLATATASLAHAASRGGWRVGCYTRPWAQFDYRVALDGIADAGYKYAGLMTTKGGVIISPSTTPEQAAIVAGEAKSRGLKIESIWGGNFSTKSLAEGVADLRKLIDNVATCGCPALLLGGIGKAELVDLYYQIVAECCDYAAAKKVGLSVKPHGGKNSTGPECRRLIEKVHHKNFGLWYDPGNIFYYSDGKLDPVDDATTVDGLVVGMSVKDYRPPKEVSLTPGTGKVDFPKVLARLKRGGFSGGPLIVECLSPGDRAQTNVEARKARVFVEELVSALKA